MPVGFYSLFDFTGIPVGQGLTQKLLYMLNEILDNVVLDLQGLNLTLNAVTVPIVKRKGVKKQPVVDPGTQITVCKDASQSLVLEYGGFGTTSAIYPIDIAIVSPNKRDWLTNLDSYISWWDSIIALFVPPSLTGTNLWGTTTGTAPATNKVWDVRVTPGDFLEPEDMANMFDSVNIILDVKATLSTSAS